MPAPRDPSTLLAAARLYYLENQSQAEIARELGTSRSNVSRMLTEAQRQGIVTITDQRPVRSDDRARARPARPVRARRGPGRPARPGVVRSRSRTRSVCRQHALLDRPRRGLDDRGTVVGPRAPGDGLRHRGRARLQPEADAARRRAVVDQQRDQRRGAGARAGHAGWAPTTSHCTPRPRSPRRPRASSLLAEQSIVDTLDLARSADLAFVGIGTPTHGSSSAILTSLAAHAGRGEGVLGGRAGRRPRRPLLRRRGHRGAVARSQTASSRSTSTTSAASPTSSGWRTAAPRPPASSAPFADASSTPWCATRCSPGRCSARRGQRRCRTNGGT